MNSKQLAESEDDGGFTFLPQQGGRIKDPAARKQYRLQVMRHVGKNRRKAGLNRRQFPLVFSLDGFEEFRAIEPLSRLPHSGTGNNGVNANRVEEPSLPRTLPEPHCESVGSGSTGPVRIFIEQLGAGALDPFIKYPFKLDDRARELVYNIYGANTGSVTPFNVVAFKLNWIEVCIIDSAAFHQFLAGAQAYYDFLRKTQHVEFSPQIVAHRARSLRIVNERIAKSENASSDGVLASLILLARYYQMIGDFANWQMHMHGLKEIIRLRGDIDSIGMNELLRHMITNNDISGSFGLASPPIFPIPTTRLPTFSIRSPSTTLSPLSTLLITLWYFAAPQFTELIDIIHDILMETTHLRTNISITKDTLWTETMYICYYINPLLHRLLSLPKTDEALPFHLMAEAIRLAASIYLGAIRYAFGIGPFQTEAHVQKIRAIFETLEVAGEGEEAVVLWQDSEWGGVKVWVLGCAAIGTSSREDRRWFLDLLHAEMESLGLGMDSHDGFERYVGEFLWVPEVHGALLRGLDT